MYQNDLVIFWSKGYKVIKFRKPGWLRNFTLDDGINIFVYDKSGETWRKIKIFGDPQEPFGTGSDYDCSGRTFCSFVNKYLGGLITVGYYGIDI
jgi:hypothetical protein